MTLNPAQENIGPLLFMTKFKTGHNFHSSLQIYRDKRIGKDHSKTIHLLTRILAWLTCWCLSWREGTLKFLCHWFHSQFILFVWFELNFDWLVPNQQFPNFLSNNFINFNKGNSVQMYINLSFIVLTLKIPILIFFIVVSQNFLNSIS